MITKDINFDTSFTDEVNKSIHAHIRLKMTEEFKVDLFELARNGSGLREEE